MTRQEKNVSLDSIRRVRLSFRIVTYVVLLSAFSSLVCAPSPQFAQMYNYYFPNGEEYLSGSYRKWFDQLLTAKRELNGHHVREAMRGERGGFHAFVHHPDRDAAGEFGLTWNHECLFLLLYLGDQEFANLLAGEDKQTREVVGQALEQSVDWTKHDFVKTAALYTYRFRRPTAETIAAVRRRTHFIAIVRLPPSNSDRLKLALTRDNRFSTVEFWLTSFNGDNAVIAAPKSLSPSEIVALQTIVQRYVKSSKVLFR